MPSLPWTEATFWVAAVACALAQLAIVRSVVVARAPNGASNGVDDGAADPDRRLTPVRRAGEVAWAVVPALALAGLLALTWRAMHPAAEPAAAASVTLGVRA